MLQFVRGCPSRDMDALRRWLHGSILPLSRGWHPWSSCSICSLCSLTDFCVALAHPIPRCRAHRDSFAAELLAHRIFVEVVHGVRQCITCGKGRAQLWRARRPGVQHYDRIAALQRPFATGMPANSVVTGAGGT